jgi:hypothetical protein
MDISPGSSADPSILIDSPATPFEFPFHGHDTTHCDINITNGPNQPLSMYSVTRVVGLSRVCGLSMGDDLRVKVSHYMTDAEALNNPSLVDRGANICVTGILDLLVEVVPIAPLPISVATKTGKGSLDDCCTK